MRASCAVGLDNGRFVQFLGPSATHVVQTSTFRLANPSIKKHDYGVIDFIDNLMYYLPILTNLRRVQVCLKPIYECLNLLPFAAQGVQGAQHQAETLFGCGSWAKEVFDLSGMSTFHPFPSSSSKKYQVESSRLSRTNRMLRKILFLHTRQTAVILPTARTLKSLKQVGEVHLTTAITLLLVPNVP